MAWPGIGTCQKLSRSGFYSQKLDRVLWHYVWTRSRSQCLDGIVIWISLALLFQVCCVRCALRLPTCSTHSRRLYQDYIWGALLSYRQPSCIDLEATHLLRHTAQKPIQNGAFLLAGSEWCGRLRGQDQLHATPDAHEPRHAVHHLCQTCCQHLCRRPAVTSAGIAHL